MAIQDGGLHGPRPLTREDLRRAQRPRKLARCLVVLEEFDHIPRETLTQLRANNTWAQSYPNHENETKGASPS